MSVLVYGLSHKSASVGLLERVAVPAERLPKALASLVRRDHVTEAVVLSTCNRVEVYAHVTRYHEGGAALRDFFAEWGGLAPSDFAERTYLHHDERAAEHLFAVASGLDSMVVGERQIHLQVRQAFAAAEAEGSCGRMLQALFRQALHVGKRTRAETGIAAGASSMVDVGLQAAERVLADLSGRTVLLVGAGKMGGMGATRLHGRARRILIANRTVSKAERLAQRVGGEVIDLVSLDDGLRQADLVITSTGAPVPLIDCDLVAKAMAARPRRPLVLLDLAVPRDVDPAANDLDGVTVLDVDAVRTLTDTGVTGVEVAKARALVEEETRRFVSWTRAVRVEPTIAALRAHAEAVRHSELSRLAGRLGDLDERQKEALEALTKGIVNTLLHAPTVRLKALADVRGADLYAAALRELFDLPD
ncbi:MAG: glutamyl-tRNA reductase [Egibacteraceae bacterium]